MTMATVVARAVSVERANAMVVAVTAAVTVEMVGADAATMESAAAAAAIQWQKRR